MKQRITYTVPNTPQGAPAQRQIDVTEERIDRDWTYFKCADGSKFGMPTRWIDKRADLQ